MPWAERVDAADAVVEWIHAAGNPYFDWLFGTAENARRVIDTWSRRRTSEVSLDLVQVVICGSDVVGGFIGVSAEDLRRRRLADAVALVTDTAPTDRQAVRARLGLAHGLFTVPPADTFYLSKMGVASAFRGKGHGTAVLGAFLDAGRDLGYRSFALDVASANQAAVRIYAAAGFVRLAETSTADGEMTYLSMRLTHGEAGPGD